MVGTARKYFEKQGLSFGLCVSLDHSIHFHKPDKINVEQWMLFYTVAVASSGKPIEVVRFEDDECLQELVQQ